MAVEYLTKEEVIGVLTGLKQERIIAHDEAGMGAMAVAIERVNKLYTVRPILTGSWKTIGERKEFIYCGRCGFKTLSYKRTAFCPNCGRRMLNGRTVNDQG